MSEETKEVAAAKLAPPPAVITTGPRGMKLGSLEDMWRFARYVASSGLAPKGLEKPEAILIAIEMGAEVGLPPMSAIQNVAVINGRPSLWGDVMLAVCRSSGVFDETAFDEVLEEAGGNLTATCTVRRLPDGKPVIRTFSMRDAAAASLKGKQGPWQQYPRRMLQMRARSWALRDTFTDALRGFRCAEEMQDVPPEKAVGEPPRTLEQLTDKLADPVTKITSVVTADEPTPVETPVEPMRGAGPPPQVDDQGNPILPMSPKPPVPNGLKPTLTAIEAATTLKRVKEIARSSKSDWTLTDSEQEMVKVAIKAKEEELRAG